MLLKRMTREVFVVGCGGIGSWLIPPLVRFLSSEGFDGTITLCDGDVYAEKNRARQEFDGGGIGRNKADVLVEKLREQYPQSVIRSCPYYIDEENVGALINARCTVFGCVDNHPARLRIAQRVVTLSDGCFISAGNELSDGDVSVTLRKGGKNLTRTLMERHPEVALSKKGDPTAGCEDLIEEGQTQLLVTNLMAATAAMAVFFKLWGLPPTENPDDVSYPQEVFFDVGKCAMSLVATGG